ncbi:hypothetical protein [Bacillus sp. 3255]|uniref:hypothetical protein n=1 Tax=Bacillus sp. 3255 TaxID=2817904 RepID=UPI002861A99E|nr:hypothetical protein [Bacillus sp. 3255]MDR6884886.1 hypothetical protein [Bacillus sp. 3255]
MARVHIEKDIFMTVEQHNCSLEKRTIGKSGESKGKEMFTPFAHYPTISGAAKGLFRLKLAESTASTLSELLAETERIEAEIKELIKF